MIRKSLFALIRASLLSLVACTFLISCDATIHEYPDELQIKQDFVLTLDFDLNVLPYTTIEQDLTRATSQALRAQQQHKVRYIVNVYKANDEGTFSRKAIEQITLYASSLAEKLPPIRLQLLPGKYRFITWADYVLSSSSQATYYDVSQFEEIKMLHDEEGLYQGNTLWRDAFIGQADAEVEPLENGSLTIEMERPLAKYRFITTDLEEFIQQAIEREQAKAEEKALQDAIAASELSATAADSAQQHTEPKVNTKGDTRSVDLNKFQVRMVYPMFVPCSFNAFTNKPADSWTAQQYEGKITQLSETEAELGFDFVFVNGSEAKITVGLALYDSDGELISSIDPITLPIKRSRLTTVRGKFLTSHTSSSVGINPSFDGEYNIEIK